MIKLTNRQQFNTFCILSNHGNDIKTFKTQAEHRAAGKVKNGVRSFCYKSFRYIMMSTRGEVVNSFRCITKLKSASKIPGVHSIFDD